METIVLKDYYSNYYIRKWVKQGLPLITERPATTTKKIFEEFIANKPKEETKEKRNKRIGNLISNRQKIDWKQYIREV